jgi:hypothetical protein
MVRRIIDEGVDWPCEVLRNYSDTNLGCGRRVSSGLNWVFEQVDRAIILEDDCLPERSFFPYCEELLERFSDDERIAMISGDNFKSGQRVSPDSYYFSRWMHIWGWATWRRAWRHYDFKMTSWPAVRDAGLLRSICPERKVFRCWTTIFEQAYRGEIDTWDYQWVFACWFNNGLGVLPECNLVTNIGCSSGGAHTADDNPWAGLPTEPLGFPLRHPGAFLRNFAADQRHGSPGTFLTRLRRKLRQLLRRRSPR